MAINYLKKTKLHKIAQYLGFDVPALKHCRYRGGRGSGGSEWLSFFNGEGEYTVELWHDAKFRCFGARTSIFDEVECRFIERNWKVYDGAAYKEIIAALEAADDADSAAQQQTPAAAVASVNEHDAEPVQQLELTDYQKYVCDNKIIFNYLKSCIENEDDDYVSSDHGYFFLSGKFNMAAYLELITRSQYDELQSVLKLRVNDVIYRRTSEAVEQTDAELEEVRSAVFDPTVPAEPEESVSSYYGMNVEVCDMHLEEAKAAFNDCKSCLANIDSLSCFDFLYWTDRFKSLSLHIYLLEQEQKCDA